VEPELQIHQNWRGQTAIIQYSGLLRLLLAAVVAVIIPEQIVTVKMAVLAVVLHEPEQLVAGTRLLQRHLKAITAG
jgi:hypothetical protein